MVNWRQVLGWGVDYTKVKRECFLLLKAYYMKKYKVDDVYAAHLAKRQLEWGQLNEEFKKELAFMTDTERLKNLL